MAAADDTEAAVVQPAVHKPSERDQVYHERSEHDFFDDLTARGAAAAERLDQHRKVQEERDASATSFPGMVPPAYLIDAYNASPARGRMFADTCNRMPLPEHGNAVNLNVTTTAPTAAAQTAENAASSEQDIAGSNVQISVNTFAASQELSRQAIVRGGNVGELIYTELRQQVETTMDGLLINGTGASGQPAGLLKASEIAAGNVLEEDSSSPSAGATYAKMTKLVHKVAVESGRAGMPDFVLCHTRRKAYVHGAVNSDDLPLFPGPELYVAGVPVIADGNIPVTLGTSSNEDRVFAYYSQDCALIESPIMFLATPTNLAKNLGYTITARKYAAFKLLRSKSAGYLHGTLFAATAAPA